MPTPVSTARQCLTGDAARALDEAVAVARRRGHAQTTSLHAVTALLSSSSSLLRDACSRARSSAYSQRHQLRALDLCFALSLDRLSSSSHSTHNQNAAGEESEPPISNSLMAAIKRSQANQRRNPPEAFHQHLQQNPCLGSSAAASPPSTSSSSSSSLLSVKVELQPLILSILDDPGVSRVFADAGFRSRDVQMALLRPPASSLLRFPRSRCPPLFLCNFTAGPNSEPGRPAFNFPFSGLSAFAGFSDLDDNCRRIGEVLVKKKSRNPLLVGVCAAEAVRSFADCLERGGATVGSANAIPPEISGLNFVWLEKWVSERSASSPGEGNSGSRFGELGQLAERCTGPGVVVNVGDLNWLLAEAVSYMVCELTRLLDLHRGRLWLMGSAANYETYMKFLTKFPSVEKDWDLQLLPITSLTPAIGGGLHSRPHSLMESFVPFGGFFSSASDLKSPLTSKCQSTSSKCQSTSRCNLCEEKCEQEVADILKGCSFSVADPSEASLPPWPCKSDLTSTKGLDVAKARDDGAVLNARVAALQKKWNDICRRLHSRSQMLPGVVGLPYVAEGKELSSDYNNKSIDACQHLNDCGDASPAPTVSLKIPLPDMNTPMPVVSESENEELTIGLSLGLLNVPLGKEQKEPTIPAQKEHLPELDSCLPSRLDVVSGSLPLVKVRPTTAVPNAYPPMRTSPSSNIMSAGVATTGHRGMGPSDMTGQLDLRDFKSLWRALIEKVGRQDEALRGISEAIARCKTGNERRRCGGLRGDIWLNILGPDRVGKKTIAMALGDILSKPKLIYVDLSLQDGADHSNSIFELGQVMNGYDATFRGLTVVDHIAGEISKNPWSVVFLENVDKADVLLQTSLLQAIRMGKFPDSHRREIGINNAVFVTTARALKGDTFSDEKECVSFSEERILAAQSWKMKILVGYNSEAMGSNSSNVLVSSWNKPTDKESLSGQVFVNKRKLDSTSDHRTYKKPLEKVKRPHWSSNTFPDLNVSAEEMEASHASCGDDENDRISDDNNHISETTEAWLEEFFGMIDGTVTLTPFDFDSLAVNILKKISKSFQTTIGCKGLLEIDSKVMEQIVAAAWLSDGKGAIEDWVEKVLGKCFAEARERYNSCLSGNSVLKLVALEECSLEEQAPGVCLPARIFLN